VKINRNFGRCGASSEVRDTDHDEVLPKSDLAKVLGYLRNNWDAIKAYASHGYTSYLHEDLSRQPTIVRCRSERPTIVINPEEEATPSPMPQGDRARLTA
jgi:hypothetical protein